MIDPEALIGTLIRWAHVLSGVLWLGSLLLLELVVAPALRGSGAGPESPHRPLLCRALWWLRWSSAAALLLGILLFIWIYHRVDGGFGNSAALKFDGRITDRALFIMLGITLAFALWCLTWFAIWPAWSAATRDPGRPPETRWTRTGIVLAGPSLALMLAPQNYAADFSAGRGGRARAPHGRPRLAARLPREALAGRRLNTCPAAAERV